MVSSDLRACATLAFEWAEACDTKNFSKLISILAPTVLVDYTGARLDTAPRTLTSSTFASALARPERLGNAALRTQHLLGAVKWEEPEHGALHGTFQIRAAHQLLADEHLDVIKEGHDHGVVRLRFVKVAGSWKISGVKPDIWWSEGDLVKLFQSVGPKL